MTAKACPILVASPSDQWSDSLCMKNKCEWWDRYNNGCVVWVIVSLLKNVKSNTG